MLNLDPRLYVDPAVLPQERNHIFARTWQLLGPVSQLSGRGDYVSADIAGLKVFVIRARDGALRGFRNVCRHRGAQLLPERTGRCSTIRCPYHQWVFGDEGQLINAPWFGDDPDFSKADWPLETIQVAEWRGLLFVAIAPEEDLVSQLGELVGELADGRLRYTGESFDQAVQDLDQHFRAAAKARDDFAGNLRIVSFCYSHSRCSPE